MRIRSMFCLLVTASLVHAQTPARTHDIVPADYASIATITQIAVSPNGKHVAYAEARWDKADDSRKTDLWLVATDGKVSPRRLTGERANDRNPKWSVDGDSIFVLGNRKRTGETKPPFDGTTQVWRVPTSGAEPQPITRIPGGIIAIDYALLGGAIFYSVDASTTDEDEFTKLRTKYPAEYGHGTRKVSEIWRLDLQSWRAEKVVAEKRYVREFAATRDGKRVAMITAPDDQVVNSEGKSRVDVWDAADRKVTTTDMSWMKTAASPYPWLENLAWNPKGDKLAFCSIFDAYPAEIIVSELTGTSWKSSRMDRSDGSKLRSEIRGYGTPIQWDEDDRIGWLSDSHATSALLFTSRGKGTNQNFSVTNGSVTGFDQNPSLKQPVELVSWSTQFPTLSIPAHTMGIESNPHTDTWKLPTIQHVTWKAPDGSTVGGVLELPFRYKKGDKLPLVVAIHGGPTTSTKAELTFDPHNGRLYFAAKGYAVLCPNYRGSTGYGDKFVTDLIGRENDIEVNDIIAGVQHLVKQGIADPERVGVMGWSNGGYLTNCLITRTDLPFKLKAASSGAGIVDTVAEWGFNDEPAYPIVFKKGLPWETPEIYKRSSPTYDLGKAKTPTLIHVGGGDERCPPGHSRMLYRALKEYNKVPTELVVYPGEPHGLTKLSHRIAKMEWDLAWFEKYLK